MSFPFFDRAPRRSNRLSNPRLGRRSCRLSSLELLEERTLLASAILDINNVTTSATLGLLTYTGAVGVANNLSIKTSTVLLDPTTNETEQVYTITDKVQNISLTAAAVADGWTKTAANIVTGPGSIKQGASSTTITSYVKSLAINLSNGNDTVAISGAGGPATLSFANKPGDLDSVTLTATGLSGNVTLNNSAGSTALTVSDSGDTTARTAFVSNGVISNIAPYLISYGAANLSSLTINGASALGTLNVNANNQGPVSITGGSVTGSGTIQIGTNFPISYSSFLAVNVSNAADQPLTQISQSVTTTTSDLPTEGKALTYLTSTFVDADSQAKAANFVATVNWGDGTPAVAGAISVDGLGHFQVSGSHTYKRAGTYPVDVTVNDAGTADALSASGIAVTISDLGGSAFTTGSVAQVNLVSSDPSIPAPIHDAKLINPWGIAGDANGQAWVADEGSGVATFEGPGATYPEGTQVVIPPASGTGKGAPVGIVFNSTANFAIGGQPSSFLYSTLDGTISGWNGQIGQPAVIALNNAAAGSSFTGLAIANNNGKNQLYVANFALGRVEVYDGAFNRLSTVTDPNVPSGYAPYNITNINGNLVVTFARRSATGSAVAGLGNGFVDVFSPSGTLMQQLISGAPLNAPWGVTLAPTTFGQFAGALLVGNQGNGLVDAFNLSTGQFLGIFSNTTGAPITNSGLNGLFVGAGGTLYFVAGSNQGTAGLFGSLTPSPEQVVVAPATLSATVPAITAFVNQPFNGTVATFTDASPYALPADFTATIQWGDGSTDTTGDGNLTITQSDGPGSAFVVTGLHRYATTTTGNPPEIVKIIINDTANGASVVGQGTASVSSPTLHATFSAFAGIVGVSYTGAVAGFTDDAPDPKLADYTATINWGDGTTTKGTIALANSAGQQYIVTDAGGHTYAAATAGRSPYVVTVAIAKNGLDSQGGPLVESATVLGNVAVTFPTLHVTFTTFPSVAGAPYSGQVAAFTDDNPPVGLQNTGADPNNFYSALINWGDGTFNFGTIVQTTSAGGAFSVLATHAYATPTVGMPPDLVTVTVTKLLTNEAAQAIGNAAVADALLAPFNQGNTMTATEGIPFTGVVAQFVSANPFYGPATFNGSFAPVINWGDGKTSLGTVTLAGSVFSVIGSHVYAAPNPVGLTNTISVAVSDFGGSKTTVTNNAAVLPAALAFIPLALPTNPAVPIVMGKAFTADVIEFASANAAAVVGEYTATINWGDGTLADVATVRLDGNGLFHVSGTHTYGAAGVFFPTITVQIIGGTRFVDAPPTITVVDAPITYAPAQNVKTDTAGATLAANKNATIGLGTVTDTDPNSMPGDITATVDWGDQSGLQAVTVTPNAASGQTYTLTGMHKYGKNGSYLVKVKVTDSDGSTATNTVGVTLGNANGVQVAGGVANNQGIGSFIIAGTPLSNVLASFTATTTTAVASDFSATIEWGDGSIAGINPDTSPGIIVQGADDPTTGAPTFFVSGSHIYDRKGVYDFTVYVSTLSASPVTFSATATVSGAPLIAQPAPISGVQGEPLAPGTVVATFVDTAPVPDSAAFASGTTAIINWGDGTTSNGTVSVQGTSVTGTTFVVYGDHTYANQNDVLESYQASVSISTPDGSGTEVADFVLLTVPVLTDPPLAVSAVAGAPFNVPVATIHSSLPQAIPASFHSNINWGDGQSSTGTLQSIGGGNFEVFGSHMYRSAGSYSITLSFTDNHGNSVTDSSTATVANAPVVVQGLPLTAMPHQLFSGPVAAFTDANTLLTAGSFAATINWGDGSTSAGIVTVSGSSSSGVSYFVTGTHNYKSKGTHQVAITILQPGVGTTTTTATATVGKMTPTPSKKPATHKAPTPKPAIKVATSHPHGPQTLKKKRA